MEWLLGHQLGAGLATWRCCSFKQGIEKVEGDFIFHIKNFI